MGDGESKCVDGSKGKGVGYCEHKGVCGKERKIIGNERNIKQGKKK